ncbi:transmembrane protein, putative (macronuclear) [Tetrahymena thermophila SB210]|uniref:Transmembrane protein, putative n=1 Tax=Tetrahymena thermophila (strain SB210) TaxID=312017 RepID=W7XF51_TETTS|nr:transmembrane protein, putative [Tetrahymena thermophila SB210]EWS72611.1 transmembrane protein, putative [Tetrahymena thermophila SB210]|eukprot:XP_012654894.1 transmembrane protein, putative [Tetrahymena thermophila SB210]
MKQSQQAANQLTAALLKEGLIHILATFIMKYAGISNLGVKSSQGQLFNQISNFCLKYNSEHILVRINVLISLTLFLHHFFINQLITFQDSSLLHPFNVIPQKIRYLFILCFIYKINLQNQQKFIFIQNYNQKLQQRGVIHLNIKVINK